MASAEEAAVAVAARALHRELGGDGSGVPRRQRRPAREFARALKLLRRYMAAIAEAPAQARVRCICVQNEVYARRLGSGAAGEALMRAVGWRRSGVELLYEGDAVGVWAQRVLAVLEEVGTEVAAAGEETGVKKKRGGEAATLGGAEAGVLAVRSASDRNCGAGAGCGSAAMKGSPSPRSLLPRVHRRGEQSDPSPLNGQVPLPPSPLPPSPLRIKAEPGTMAAATPPTGDRTLDLPPWGDAGSGVVTEEQPEEVARQEGQELAVGAGDSSGGARGGGAQPPLEAGLHAHQQQQGVPAQVSPSG
jgi:hypothetical protein